MSAPIVIQGFFPHGAPRPPAGSPPPRGGAVALPAAAFRPSHRPGAGLPPAVQAKMEAAFGTSFAGVRIHVGPEAGALGAAAFAAGNQLYFAPGRYDPHSAHGRRLLAHELCHVVQQRAGRARNPFGAGAALLCDPLLEAEADRLSHRAAAAFDAAPAPPARAPVRPLPGPPHPGRPPAHGLHRAPAHRGGPPVQLRPAPHGRPRHPGQRGLSRPAPRPAVRPVAVQPFCNWFTSLFSCCRPKKPKARFEDDYEVRSLVRSGLEDAEEALRDTTCTNGADNMVKVLGTGPHLANGRDLASLGKYMRGKGGEAAKGVVIRCRLGPLGHPLHSFTIEQRGDHCQLYQAWLDSFSLEEGLGRVQVETVDHLLARLKVLQDSLDRRYDADTDEIRGHLSTVFGVKPSEKDWGQERNRWVTGAVIDWDAVARK